MYNIDLILENIRLGHIEHLMESAQSDLEVIRGQRLINESMMAIKDVLLQEGYEDEPWYKRHGGKIALGTGAAALGANGGMFGTQVQNATHNALDSLQNVNNDAWKHMSNGFKNTADYYGKTAAGQVPAASGTDVAGHATSAVKEAPKTTAQLADELHKSQYQDFLTKTGMEKRFAEGKFDQGQTLNTLAHDQNVANGGLVGGATETADAIHAHGGNALMGAGIGAGLGGLVGGALGKSKGAGIGTMLGSGIGGLAGAFY